MDCGYCDCEAHSNENLQCGRCRKRKIRCSGDNDGLGCGNCKAASVEPGGCKFLRVQLSFRICAMTTTYEIDI